MVSGLNLKDLRKNNMSFLPEISDDGKIIMPSKEDRQPKLYTPPVLIRRRQQEEEERQAELNTLGTKIVTEDFSDSPALDK